MGTIGKDMDKGVLECFLVALLTVVAFFIGYTVNEYGHKDDMALAIQYDCGYLDGKTGEFTWKEPSND